MRAEIAEQAQKDQEAQGDVKFGVEFHRVGFALRSTWAAALRGGVAWAIRRAPENALENGAGGVARDALDIGHRLRARRRDLLFGERQSGGELPLQRLALGLGLGGESQLAHEERAPVGFGKRRDQFGPRLFFEGDQLQGHAGATDGLRDEHGIKPLPGDERDGLPGVKLRREKGGGHGAGCWRMRAVGSTKTASSRRLGRPPPRTSRLPAREPAGSRTRLRRPGARRRYVCEP